MGLPKNKDRKSVAWYLAGSNLLSALAGGWILSDSSGKLSAIEILEHFGPLMALVLGSFAAVFSLWLLRNRGLRETRFLPLSTVAASSILLLLDQRVPAFGTAVAWLYFATLAARWMFWASARATRGALAGSFGKNPWVEMFAFIGLVIGAELPNFVSLTTAVVLIADIALQTAAFAIDFVASRLPFFAPANSTVTYVAGNRVIAIGGTTTVTFTARNAVHSPVTNLTASDIAFGMTEESSGAGTFGTLQELDDGRYSVVFTATAAGSVTFIVSDDTVKVVGKQSVSITTTTETIAKESTATEASLAKKPPRYPFLRAVLCIIGLIAGTQMILFAERGVLPGSILKQHLISMVYLGGVIASLCCHFGEARLVLSLVDKGASRMPKLIVWDRTIPVLLIVLAAFVAVGLAVLTWDTMLAPIGVVAATCFAMLIIGPLFNSVATKGNVAMAKQAYGWMFFGAIVCLAALSVSLSELVAGPKPSEITHEVLVGTSLVLLFIGGAALFDTRPVETRGS